ncbi:3-hydroxybutyrate oligomer hydrolase family protein [Aliikangiella marina]|nr:3-hydroxybutyrate oligomer hydrolase family protein [Aliikangiella marina]
MVASANLSKTLLLLMFLMGSFSIESSTLENDSLPLDYIGPKIIHHYYDGKDDDLLTAGWSHTQLTQRKLPTTSNQSDPKTLRKIAYFNNFIALLDTTESGGYGKFFGPNKTQPSIPGHEYLTYAITPSGTPEATLALQIPDNFDLNKNCIIVAATSGSRGIYGAVGTVGTWALTNRCAVAYTDKGTGTGFYFYDQQSGYDIQGNYRHKNQGLLSYLPKKNQNTKSFLKQFPTAIATKQAYSGDNIERKFGEFVYKAGEFALYQLNQHFKQKRISFTRQNTTIIAASISNGGVASIRGVEYDETELFDGLVVSEPNIYPQKNSRLAILQQSELIENHSLPGIEYFMTQYLLEPCSLLSEKLNSSGSQQDDESRTKILQDWCDKLKADGFIVGDSYQKLAHSSLEYLKRNGINHNNQVLSSLMYTIQIGPSLATTYVNQLGRFKIEDKICGNYFTAFDKLVKPRFLSLQERQLLFAKSSGIPRTASIEIGHTNQLDNYERAKCFYDIVKTDRVQNGIKEVIATQNLHNVPTIIIHGQNDNLIAPNHSSRPYYANLLLSGKHDTDKLKYYEITNAQHFDSFLSFPAFAKHYVPLHHYFEQSLELMLAHLQKGKTLPPSQVVATSIRSVTNNTPEKLTLRHLPGISMNPRLPIKLDKNILIIP